MSALASDPDDGEFAPYPADYLSEAQLTQLLRPINAQRVSKANGFEHVQGYDVRAHLIRIFGFARFDVEVLACHLVFESESESESKAGRAVWTVCYLARVQIKVRSAAGHRLASYSDVATGDATNQPSRADAHDMAAKTAATTALKRAAVNLGDQFGLSLYNKGSLAPLVRGTLVDQPAPAAEETAAVDEHITTPLAPETAVAEDEREYSTPAPRGPVTPPETDEAGDARAAAAVVAAAIPGATAEPPTDPWEWVLAELDKALQSPPEQARAQLGHIMEIAVRHRLRTRRLPETNETLGATLTRRMAQARAAEMAKQSRQDQA